MPYNSAALILYIFKYNLTSKQDLLSVVPILSQSWGGYRRNWVNETDLANN